MTERRFLQIQETLRQHRASYRTDCDEADDYRRDMQEMIAYVKELQIEIETYDRITEGLWEKIERGGILSSKG